MCALLSCSCVSCLSFSPSANPFSVAKASPLARDVKRLFAVFPGFFVSSLKVAGADPPRLVKVGGRRRSLCMGTACALFWMFLLAQFVGVVGWLRPFSWQQAPLELSKSQLQAYERDGAIIVRGLLRGRQLADAIKKGRELARDAPKKEASAYAASSFQDLHREKLLRDIALSRDVGSIVRQLMPGEDIREIRVLKDAFLASVPGKKGCGWHRDGTRTHSYPHGPRSSLLSPHVPVLR